MVWSESIRIRVKHRYECLDLARFFEVQFGHSYLEACCLPRGTKFKEAEFMQ
jgi:hypothetical protein